MVKDLNRTTIQGKTDKSFIVKTGIIVDLNSGDDKFEIGGTVFIDDVNGRLNTEMGSGKDIVSIGHVAPDGDTTINTDFKDDKVHASTFAT